MRLSCLFFTVALLVTPNSGWAIEDSPALQSGATQSSSSQVVDRSVTPDEVTTSDGSTVQGTVTGMLNGQLSLKSKFAHTIQIGQNKVTSILTTGELDVVMYDSRRLRGTLASNADGSIVITPTDGSAAEIVNWSEIGEIWQLPPSWDGGITFGFSENSGNSEAFGGTLGLDATRNGERDRISGKAHLSLLEAFEETAVQKMTGSLYYAHYLRARTYFHVTQDLQHDVGQDLRIQSGSHVGVGYIVVERPNSMLTVAFGVGVFVNRYEVDTVNDDTNFSGRGEVGVRIPFGDGIELLNDLIFFVHNSSHVNNTLAVKFTLAADWKLTFGSNLQVSSDPSILADRWDHQTMMGIAYSF